MPLATNKVERINQYRKIAAYSLCNWCLDEIADDFIIEDDDDEFIKLTLPDRLNATQQDILQNEFKKYINLFNVENDGYNLVKRFLTEGELAWENVINPEYQKLGIVGVKFLPAEYYETLIDQRSGRPVGLVFDTETFAKDKRDIFSATFAGAASIFNSITPNTYSFNFSKRTSVPMLWSQVTYINSGDYSHDFMVSYPLIERAKQDYHRLALLEDSAVILRVTHAPERLVFNVSTGQMDQNRADEYVRRFAQQLVQKKVALPNGEDIANVYNPVTMLKHYIFGKSMGNDGTSVESVSSSASYDEMGDIEYFLRAFLKQFKIPFSRWKTPENTIEKNDAISYEEHTFSRMVIRLQKRFAEGFKRGFITHLKLRGIWDNARYSLQDRELKVKMTPPVLYDLYEKQKLVEAKMTIYKAYADQDELSKIVAMKKALGMTDAEIEENFNTLIELKQRVAIADYFAEQVSAENPPVNIKSPIRLKNDALADEKSNVGEDSENGDEENGENDGGDEGPGGDEAPPSPPDEGGTDNGGEDEAHFGF